MKCIAYLLFFLFSESVYSQVFDGDLLLTSQSDVDAFFDQNPLSTSIHGSVQIIPAVGSDITDLSGFLNIQSISGSLQITNNSDEPMSLSSFTALDTIGNELLIYPANNSPEFTGSESFNNLLSLGSFRSLAPENFTFSFLGLEHIQ